MDNHIFKKLAQRINCAVWKILVPFKVHCPGGVEEAAHAVGFYAWCVEEPILIRDVDFSDFLDYYIDRQWDNKHTPGNQWIRQGLLSMFQQEFKPVLLGIWGLSDPSKAANGATSQANQAKVNELLENENWAKGASGVYGGNRDLYGAAEMVLQDVFPNGVFYSDSTFAYILESARNLLSPSPRMVSIGRGLNVTVGGHENKIDRAALRDAGVPAYSEEQVLLFYCMCFSFEVN
jgi:hypothetical protein